MPLQSVAALVEPAIQQFQRMTVDDEHTGLAQGTMVYHGNEAMKKNFMRKKEMSSVDDGGKKQQKAKGVNARK